MGGRRGEALRRLGAILVSVRRRVMMAIGDGFVVVICFFLKANIESYSLYKQITPHYFVISTKHALFIVISDKSV